MDKTSWEHSMHRVGCKKWDTCAPEAILHAMGGKLTDMKGQDYQYHSTVSICVLPSVISCFSFSVIVSKLAFSEASISLSFYFHTTFSFYLFIYTFSLFILLSSSNLSLCHGIYIRWYLIRRCARKKQSLLFDLYKAFD